MTEAEWLTCADPWEIADFLGPGFGGRKLRLFGCACVRIVWDVLPDEALRQAIMTCERFVDGLATIEELKAARESAIATSEGTGDIIADHSAIAVAALCQSEPYFPMGEGSDAGISAVAAEAWFDTETPWYVARAKAQKAHCQFFRDIFTSPFRPAPTFDPAWLKWHDATILRLAQQMYDSRDFTSMPILADALEEAGCTNADILNHCRQSGVHVRGCWVVDLVLGKE